MIGGVRRRIGPISISLVLLLIVYIAAYAMDPYRPGARPAQPLGWYGWADQGLYLRSAQALASGNLVSSEHTYPILYPLLGSIFICMGLPDPFVAINLTGLLVLVGTFLVVASARIGARWAMAVFWLSFLLMPAVYRQFVFPWTTVLTTALFSGLIWELHRGAGNPGRDSPLDCFRFTLYAFLLVPARPLDAVVSAPLCLLFGWRLLATVRRESITQSAPWALRRLTACMLGASIGLGLHFGSNLLIHGSLQGRYGEAVAQAGGLQFDNLGAKLVSLLLDSGTLFGDPSASLLGHYPWGIVVLVTFPLVLWLGDGLIRAIALMAALQLFLYASFVDLLPGALWKYHNIRYFSWGAPYALLFVALAVAGIRQQWALPRGRAIILTAVAAMLVLSAVRLRAVPLPAEIAMRSPTQVALTRPSEGAAVDFIDLKGIGGAFTDLYFGTPSIRAAGQEYRHIQHFRLIPTDFGARLVAFRPLRGPEIVMNLDPRTPLAPDAEVRAYRYTFGIGAPAWLARIPAFISQGVSRPCAACSAYPRFYLEDVSGLESSQNDHIV